MMLLTLLEMLVTWYIFVSNVKPFQRALLLRRISLLGSADCGPWRRAGSPLLYKAAHITSWFR